MESLTAIDVMTDRGRVKSLPEDATAADLVNLARETGHSRFPVMDKDGEDFISIALLRRAIAIPHDRRGDVSVSSRSVSIAADQVPESVGILPLLVELRDGVAWLLLWMSTGLPRASSHWKTLLKRWLAKSAMSMIDAVG